MCPVVGVLSLPLSCSLLNRCCWWNSFRPESVWCALSSLPPSRTLNICFISSPVDCTMTTPADAMAEVLRPRSLFVCPHCSVPGVALPSFSLSRCVPHGLRLPSDPNFSSNFPVPTKHLCRISSDGITANQAELHETWGGRRGSENAPRTQLKKLSSKNGVSPRCHVSQEPACFPPGEQEEAPGRRVAVSGGGRH